MSPHPQCIITGCDLVSGGLVYHGDLHRLGNTLIFNAAIDPGLGGMPIAQSRRPNDKHVAPEDWFERRGVFVFLDGPTAHMSAAARDYIGEPA